MDQAALFVLAELQREIPPVLPEDDVNDVWEAMNFAEELERGQRAAALERVDGFFENTVPNLTDLQYKEQFRFSRETVGYIIDLLGRQQQQPLGAGRAPPLREKQVLLTLWYLGSIVSIRKVAMLFGVGTSTAWSYVTEITSILMNLRHLYVKMPETAREQDDVSEGFEALKGVRGVIGSLDGCHVPMNKPINTADPEAYINRKGFYSVNLLAVCDAKRKFLDICVGWPGSVHDSRVFKNSSLGRRLIDQNFIHPGKFIIADAAFQLQPWLMTPFRENQRYLGPDPADNDRKKRHYNRVLSSTRVKVEHTFGVLKGRFRRLTFVESKSVEKVVQLIVACCVLHNLSMQRGDEWDEVDEGVDEAVVGVPRALEQHDQEHPELLQRRENAAAVARRDELVEELWLLRR